MLHLVTDTPTEPACAIAVTMATCPTAPRAHRINACNFLLQHGTHGQKEAARAVRHEIWAETTARVSRMMEPPRFSDPGWPKWSSHPPRPVYTRRLPFQGALLFVGGSGFGVLAMAVALQLMGLW